MCIALNPSTAHLKKTDPTTRNIDKISRLWNYDGWYLINLSAQRSPHPNNLSLKRDYWAKKNTAFIRNFIKNNRNHIGEVLCAWGNNIEKRTYLFKNLDIILDILAPYELPLTCIGLTKKGHPMHPSPQAINKVLGNINCIKKNPLILDY